MLSYVADSVIRCEEHARHQTVRGVNVIKQLGILHVSDEYRSLNFRPDVMFRRRRDTLARRVDISAGLWDLVDWSDVLQWQEKVAGSGMALTIAAGFGSRMIGMPGGWMDHAFSFAKVVGNNDLRRLIIPGAIVAAVATAAYLLNRVPKSLPRHLSSKIAAHLSAIDYVHANATRVSQAARNVLCSGLAVFALRAWDAPYVLDDPICPFKEHLQLLPKRTGGSTLTLVFPVFLYAGEAI
ncbi:hypothetical protein NKR23_g12397 [Pleurostoma richardsiae]|uniref:Uncharacterized protein n=1 Tax=Pleurostoma richardsiae TaxID=41990 RepID=A0AA38R1U7_9PEZI|nr:hypothetical protein NKR23_g12397 [Pleurostoma richardsiae]